MKNLHKHVRKAHVNSEIDGNSTQWLHCDYCPKFFNTKRALGIHIVKFHQDENRKYDPKTQKLIKTEDIQVDPEDIEKKIPCDYCPKYFKTRENHLKVHLQKKHPGQFGCGILKMVGPKMQDFLPRINKLKEFFLKTILQ